MKLLGREGIPDADTVGDWLRSACALHADRRMGDPPRGQGGLIGLGQVKLPALTGGASRKGSFILCGLCPLTPPLPAHLAGHEPVRDILNQRILHRYGIREYTLDADAMPIEAEKLHLFRSIRQRCFELVAVT